LVDAVLAAGAVAPIAWLRRAPLRSAAVGLAAIVSWGAVAAPSDPLTGFAPAGLLLGYPFAIGARYTLRMASAGLVLCLIATAAVLAVDPHQASAIGAGLVSSAWLIIGAWAAGYAVGERSRLLSALADTTEETERQHSLLARERLREMILAVAEDHDQAAAVPRIDRLIDRMRAAGMRVELVIDGGQRPAGVAIEHTAYRIVQEALTNAARHAEGAEVHVRVRFSETELAIDIENAPSHHRGDPGEGVGHGLRGMRERAASCGGELAATNQPDGGFLVAAHLPLVGSQ
jgi:hypothetical protein